MKRQIKRVLTILFAVLFIATMTASAVSAEEAVTLKIDKDTLERAFHESLVPYVGPHIDVPVVPPTPIEWDFDYYTKINRAI